MPGKLERKGGWAVRADKAVRLHGDVVEPGRLMDAKFWCSTKATGDWNYSQAIGGVRYLDMESYGDLLPEDACDASCAFAAPLLYVDRAIRNQQERKHNSVGKQT